MNSSEEQVVTLSEICRVCLIKTDNMRHLLEPSDEVIQTLTKLSSVSNVEIEINEILPCFLCNSCEEKLKISYEFQQLCQKSHNFILNCLSTSSVSCKVNSFKPLQFENNSGKSGIQSVDNNSDGFISFIDSDGLAKKALISYYSVPDIDLSTHNDNGTLKENPESELKNWAQVVVIENVKDGDNDNSGAQRENSENALESSTRNVNENVEGDGLVERNSDNATENIEVKKIVVIHENNKKPAEVEKRTKYNQTMRLSQFSREDVEKIIEEFREKCMKHVNCKHCGFIAKDSRALSAHMTRLHKEMKEHWCFWCNDNFDNLQEHNRTVHKDNFKCPLCGKYKTNTGHFMEHLASHCTERRHICTVCCKCFISQRHLRMHLKIHTNQKPYRCPVCSKVFTLITKFNNHLKIHKSHKCKVCEERFPTLEEYNVHKCFAKRESEKDIVNTAVEELAESKQTSEKMPQNFCETCNKRVRSLQKHIASVHSDSVDVKDNKILRALCPYCGKQFVTVAKLTVHIRYHTGEMPYKCSYCDKRVRTRIQLVMHERTHTGERPYKCKFCGKAFAQSSGLKTHLKRHTGRPEECFMCHKRFCRPSELKLHMRTHTGEKPFECKICGQRFTQQSRLTEHSRNHTNERPYKCDYCDKSFKQSSTLRYHTNMHLGRKPYKCSQCPYESRQSHNLKQHLLQHEKEPKVERIHECDICCQSFINLEMYSLHYANKHGSIVAAGFAKEDLIEPSTVEVIDHLHEFT
ncbi:zinc finger protein 431-like [Anoplophora glabripennis]|uniref:zinc finger protein 431-like n=1 Tax=Anoplophora glabripennis TaxID=217634 RepID=UPI000874CBE0|nr:zinc finger protein 431-like [Anoplophora glabripennis]